MSKNSYHRNKAYHAWKSAERRRELKRKAIEYKGGKCIRCGYNRCDGALHFHHINPEKKEFGIAIGNTLSWERLKIEVDKCVLICANCHAEEHHKEREEKIKEQERIVRHYIKERNIDVKKEIICDFCSKVFKAKVTDAIEKRYCNFKCAAKASEKNNWPTNEKLSELVWILPLLSLSKKLGVTKKAIAKRCKNHGIKLPPKGYWARKEHRKIYINKNVYENKKISKEELAKLLWEMPTVKIAEQFGVSDKAVEKWAKKYGLTKPPRGYWAKHAKTI